METSIAEKRTELLKRMHKAFIPAQSRQIILPDGRMGTWTYDFRPLLMDGNTLDLICDVLWEELKGELPYQVGGLETAAIALVSGMLVKARSEGEDLTGFYVRKSRRKDGLQKQVEGNLTDEKVILFDDALNSARSFERQIKALEAEGKKVYAICALIRYREKSFYSTFQERGIKLINIFTLDDFPESGGIKKHEHEHPASPPQERFVLNWKFQSADPSYFYVLPKSAPAIDDERVYFGADNGTFWALKQSDGSVAWSYRTLFGAGKKRIFSSPAVYKGMVYFGAYDGNFYALDAKTGEKKWIYREADWVGSSPCIAEDLNTVFIGLEFGLWRKQGGIAALDAKTGEKKWWQQFDTFAHSSPAYSKKLGMVVIGSSSGEVRAFDARTGTLRWSHKAEKAVRAGFAFDEERGYVCFGSEDRFIYVLDARTGAEVHKIETLEPIYSTPLVYKGRLYFGVLDKRMFCIDLADGKVLWTAWAQSRVFSTPIIIDNHLFYGSNDGRLYELDAETGKEISYFQVTERIVNKVAYNAKTKLLFLPTYANELYCLQYKTADHT